MNTAWDIIQEKLEGWWLYSIRMLPNFILALFVLVVFLFIARIARRLTYGFVLRISKSISVTSLFSGLIYSGIMVAGLMSALDILELDKTVSSLLAGVGIIGLALGFAFQDITSNFISGAFIALKRPFDVGHIVETNGFTGTIEEIKLRSTTLRTSAGLHVIIPNKEIFQKPIINYSRTEMRKVELEFLVPNFVDANFLESIISKALQKSADLNHFKKIDFYFTAIESPNMRVRIGIWTDRIEPGPFLKARHSAILSIYGAFRQNGIYEIKIEGPPGTNVPPEANQNG